MEPREEIKWFAKEMEKKLRKNDYKGGWRGESVDFLMNRILEELIVQRVSWLISKGDGGEEVANLGSREEESVRCIFHMIPRMG